MSKLTRDAAGKWLLEAKDGDMELTARLSDDFMAWLVFAYRAMSEPAKLPEYDVTHVDE